MTEPMNLAVSSLCNRFRNQFGANKVELFVFTGAQDFGAFTGHTDFGDKAGALTFKPVGGSHIYCNPWEKGSIGTSTPESYDGDKITEVTAHEFGHVYDIINHVSSDGSWLALLTSDVNTLNAASNPCTGPFNGVTDLNTNPTQTVCDGGTLRSTYTGRSNEQICIVLEDFLFTSAPELHAQMFAWALVGGLGARPMADAIFANGYFNQLFVYASTSEI